MNFDGLWVPVVTPFDEAGQINQPLLEQIVDVLINQGVNGLVAVGTTGENYALTFDERHRVISIIVKAANGRVPVISGVGGMSTNEALDQAHLAKRLDCVGMMLAAPAYSLPTPTELIDHVNTVVNATGLATCLYDYPARTGTPFTLEILQGVADNEHILGIKEASGDLSRLEYFEGPLKGKIDPVCGADADSYVFFDRGATSWIGGIGNALAKAHLGIMNPETRMEAHAAVLPLLSYIEEGRYNAKVKALMTLLGVPAMAMRGPNKVAEQSVIDELAARLEQAGDWAPRLM